VLVGATIHVVPGQEGVWHVVDPRKRSFSFPNQRAALEYAKQLAAQHPPSQVVLFNTSGQMIPVARFELPDYKVLPEQGNGTTLIEAAIKALVIGGLVAAGVSVLSELVDNVNRELKNESSGSKSGRRRASPA
jgi:hypothetical protein